MHYRVAAQFIDLLKELKGKRVVVIGHQRPTATASARRWRCAACSGSQKIDAICVNPTGPRRIRSARDTPFFQRTKVAHDGRVPLYTDCADHGRRGTA